MSGGEQVESLMKLADSYARAWRMEHKFHRGWQENRDALENALRAAFAPMMTAQELAARVADGEKWKIAVPPEQPALTDFTIHLDECASGLLRDTIGKAEDDDAPSPVTLSLRNGELYVWLTECPEEGSILIACQARQGESK